MTLTPHHYESSRYRRLALNAAIMLVAMMVLAACESNTGDGTAPFLPGKYCFASPNERFMIENGVMSTKRRNLVGIPARVQIRAKTGQQAIYPQERVVLLFDEGGEYLDRGRTNIAFWPFSKKDRGDVTIIASQYDRSVTFKSVACEIARRR